MVDPLTLVAELGGDARSPVGAVGLGVDLGDALGKLGVGPGPLGPCVRAGQPPVEPGPGDGQDPAQPLDAEGATMIVNELETAQEP